MKIYELLEKLKGVDERRDVGVQVETISPSFMSACKKMYNVVREIRELDVKSLTLEQAGAALKRAQDDLDVGLDCDDAIELDYRTINDAKSVNGTMDFELTL